ncbi:alpha/beta-hydrolase [Corynespora cassiicola Philippines]|uniref:Alpha/beta-hydrolase n=1 Tax=Corynespora cassiicola Philippines TaxID=1448308 RepID=A0A2T2NA60_CORCC|nr:alpha/beta-hydrolase [Corynespora cassiicola Philippines]
MSPHGFFQYLRLKIIATIIRTLMQLTVPRKIRYDNDLSLKYDVQRQKIRIPSRDEGRYIEAELFYPAEQKSLKLPVLVNWHGSGFVLPLHGSDVLYCARVAKELGIYVLDADYRKGPEYPYPAAVNDAEDALKWVATQTGFDKKRVAVSGFSAGGNLALVAASALRKTVTQVSIAAVAAIYPVTDISIAPEAKESLKPDVGKKLPPFLMHLFNDAYVPDREMRKDPRVSPFHADPAEFPPTVAITACEGDVLAPEAIALANKLDDGKRKVAQLISKDMHHGFDKAVAAGSNFEKRQDEVYAFVIKTLKEVFHI